MNYSKVILIILSLGISNYSVAQEISQCEIGIDYANTHFRSVDNGIFEVRTLVHHPNGGNDDAAREVFIQIQIPHRSSLIGDIEMEFISNDGTIDFIANESNSNFYLYKVSHLQRYEHVDIKFQFTSPCQVSNHGDKVMVSVWPTRPIDINGSNNVWFESIECPVVYTNINPILLNEVLIEFNRSLKQYVLKFPKICMLIDCNELRDIKKPRIITIPNTHRINNIELHYKGQLLARAAYQKKSNEFVINLQSGLEKYELSELEMIFQK